MTRQKSVRNMAVACTFGGVRSRNHSESASSDIKKIDDGCHEIFADVRPHHPRWAYLQTVCSWSGRNDGDLTRSINLTLDVTNLTVTGLGTSVGCWNTVIIIASNTNIKQPIVSNDENKSFELEARWKENNGCGNLPRHVMELAAPTPLMIAASATWFAGAKVNHSCAQPLRCNCLANYIQ